MWRRQGWNACWQTIFHTDAPDDEAGERGAWFVWVGRYSPGQTTSWGWTSVYSGTCRSGTPGEIISLNDLRVTLHHHPEGTHKVPQAAHAASPTEPNHPDKIGWDVCGPLTGYLKDQGEGGKEEHIYLGGHLEARLHKSLCTPRSRTQPGTHTAPQP